MLFIALHAAHVFISFSLLNNISLTVTLVKIKRKVRKKGNLEATIGILGDLEVLLGLDQDQGAYTPLQFKLGSYEGRLIGQVMHTS